MKKNITSLFFLLSLSLFMVSCSKKQSLEGDAYMTVEFDNIVGGQNLYLNSTEYKNATGETFNISLLQYYISNIKLRKKDGTVYTVPQDSSYFLIKESEPETRFARFKAPVGDYDYLEFVLGIDSLRSTMDISKRTGVLDPAGGMDNGMYWGWNSGYIFFKMEGSSPAATTTDKKYRYHIGLFGGYSAPTINNIKNISIDLNASGIAQVRKGRNANIHLMVDILKVFNGSTTLSIAENHTVMVSAFSANIANNYEKMFYHDHTEN